MKIIYQNADGFRVTWKHGYVGGLHKSLQAALERYGMSDPPDLVKLQGLMAAVAKWMNRKTMGWNIGYPVYSNDAFFDELKQIVNELANVNERGMDVETARYFIQSAMERFRQADENHYSDVMSR